MTPSRRVSNIMQMSYIIIILFIMCVCVCRCIMCVCVCVCKCVDKRVQVFKLYCNNAYIYRINYRAIYIFCLLKI